MCIANTQASSIIMLRSFRIYVFAEKKQDGLISDSTFISVYLIYYADWGEGQEKLPNMCVKQILKHIHVEKLQNIFAEKKQDGLISDNTFISVYLINCVWWVEGR